MISKIQPTLFKTHKRLAVVACSAAIAASVQSIPSWAQSELALEEVIVFSRYREESLQEVPDTIVALDALENPQAFEPVNLGPEINTAAMEYFPALSADGQQLVWTYRNPEGHRRDEDFYFSSRVDGMWQPGAAVQGRLNTPFNEGAQCIPQRVT